MTAPPFATEALVQGSSARLVLRGELDDAAAATLDARVARLLEQGISELVVDLREVDYLGSGGLHALAALDVAAREDGLALRFVRATGTPWRALEAVGMADRLAWGERPADG